MRNRIDIKRDQLIQLEACIRAMTPGTRLLEDTGFGWKDITKQSVAGWHLRIDRLRKDIARLSAH